MNTKKELWKTILAIISQLAFGGVYIWIYFHGSLFGFTKEQIAVFCFDISFILVVLSIILTLIAIIAMHIICWYRLRKLKK